MRITSAVLDREVEVERTDTGATIEGVHYATRALDRLKRSTPETRKLLHEKLLAMRKAGFDPELLDL